MKLNPVYGKEVKLRVRTVKFALTIFFYNLILIGIALFGFEVFFNIQWNAQIDYSGAARVYFIITCFEAIMVIFLIPVFTAGSIAGEREKQTLEILLTTILKPQQIVIGKLMSSISMVLLLILSSLPVVSIVFTIGGVGMTDLLQFVVTVFVMSLYVGSIGMFASSFLKKTLQAIVFSFGMVVIICIVTAVFVLFANAFANMYYYNVMGGKGIVPDVSWAGYVLLINPAFTIINMSVEQYGSESLAFELFRGLNTPLSGAAGGGLSNAVNSFVMNHWLIISLLCQLLITALLLKMSARFLNPLRRRKEKERKESKKARKKKKRGDADEEDSGF